MEGEIKVGPSLLLGVKYLAIDLMEAGVFGGVYVNAQGRLEPIGIMGIAKINMDVPVATLTKDYIKKVKAELKPEQQE